MVHRKKLSRQQQKTRKALMDATIKLILLHGYDELTITAICHEADYTRRAFYLHFSDKANIVQQVVIEWYQAYQSDLMRAIEGLDSPIREYTLWNHNLRIIIKNITFFRQLPDMYTHDLGRPIRAVIGQAIMDNILNREVKFRDAITPELLVQMEMNLFGLVIRTLKASDDVDLAKQLIDDHFRLLFNEDPPTIDISHL